MGRISHDNLIDNIENFHKFGIYVPTRTIKLEAEMNFDDGGELGVGFSMSSKFLKNLTILESLNSDPITVIFETFGGCEYHGFSVYDAIKASPCHIIIRCCGAIMSMGTIILQAGDERVLRPHTSMMFHDGIGFAGGNHYETRNMAEFESKVGLKGDKIIYDKINEKRVKDNKALMAKRTFEEMCLKSKWMFAEEAVDMGLADRIEYPQNHE